MIYAASITPGSDLPGIGYGTRRVLMWRDHDSGFYRIFCPYKLIQTTWRACIPSRWAIVRYQFSSHKAQQALRILTKRRDRWDRIGRTHVSPAVWRDVTNLLQERIDARTPRNFARNAALPPPGWFQN